MKTLESRDVYVWAYKRCSVYPELTSHTELWSEIKFDLLVELEAYEESDETPECFALSDGAVRSFAKVAAAAVRDYWKDMR